MFTNPQKNIEQLALTPGMKVADLGAGSGFYTFEIAKIVTDAGRVYAVDIQQDLLTRIKNRARAEHLSNIEVVWGDLEKIGGTRLRESSLDVVVVSNILFQIKDRATFIKEVKRILKSHGRIFISDWTDSFDGMGPHPEDVITENSAQTIFETAGFRFIRSISAGDHHYGMVLEKEK